MCRTANFDLTGGGGASSSSLDDAAAAMSGMAACFKRATWRADMEEFSVGTRTVWRQQGEAKGTGRGRTAKVVDTTLFLKQGCPFCSLISFKCDAPHYHGNRIVFQHVPRSIVPRITSTAYRDKLKFFL